MTSSSASPPPSNGSLPHDPASILLGMKFGERLTQLQHKTDSHDQRITACERHLLQQARVQSLIMDGLTTISRLYATQAQEKTTSSQTETGKGTSTATAQPPSSTLSRLSRKLARKLSPDFALWLLGRIGAWLIPYLLAWAFMTWQLVKVYLKWLGAAGIG